MTNKEALATVLELAQDGETMARTDKQGHPSHPSKVKENADAILQVDKIWEAMKD